MKILEKNTLAVWVIAAIAFLMQFQTILPLYYNIIKANGIRYLILFCLFAILLKYIITIKNSYKFGVLIAATIILGNFTSYFAIIVSVTYLIIILCVGEVIATIFKNKDDKTLINKFTFGYCILANIWNIPYLNNSIHLKEFYIISIVAALLFILVNRKKIKVIYIINDEIKNDSKIYLLFTLYIVAASITAFSWDDLNAYLFFPLKSIIENRSVLSPAWPGSLIFQSLHSLSFTSALGIWGDKNYSIVYYYKFFNVFSYILLIIASYDIFKKIFKNNNYIQITFYTIAASSIWCIEITGNYTDFPLLLLSFYSLNFLSKLELKDIDLSIFEYIIYSLFIAITLKSLVIIIPFVVIDVINKYNKGKYELNILLLPIFLLPILLRNYLYSGNPTFPAGNNIWKSVFFDTDKNNIVVSRYMPSAPVDLNLFFNFYSVSNSALSNFFGNMLSLYSPFFYFLTSFTILLILFNFLIFKSNKYLILGIYFFFLTVFLPGAQHRYFIGTYLFTFIGMMFIYEKRVKIIFNQSFIKAIIYCLIFLFPTSQYVTNKLYIDDGKIFSKNGFRDWSEKIKFYEKLNSYFEVNNIKPKILMHYLQDKIFIKHGVVIEYDWYDYTEVKEIIEIMNTSLDEKNKRFQVNELLCKKGFDYLILSDSNTIFIDKKTTLVIKGVQQSLYKLNCDG
jgi:hypothetical protein